MTGVPIPCSACQSSEGHIPMKPEELPPMWWCKENPGISVCVHWGACRAHFLEPVRGELEKCWLCWVLALLLSDKSHLRQTCAVRNVLNPLRFQAGQFCESVWGHCWQLREHSWVYRPNMIFQAALVSPPFNLSLRVKPLGKQGFQPHSVLLSRASGHLFQFPMTAWLPGFCSPKNTLISSTSLKSDRGTENEKDLL